ncbi:MULTISPECIES: hypothetical protein [unclassified Glutamicibacter]|uniref:hypothetical protein n=1 Tax=unclassified Glutamicibacter TaxID=2627139 RepID=UPI003802657A
MVTKKVPAAQPDDVATTKQVFVISPIGSVGSEKNRKATLALDYIIKKALPDDRWEVTRGDGSLSPDSIGHDIIKRIDAADLIVADLTDHNANVFYELAIAHGWNKPVIHMIEQGQPIPFDIADLRVISYELQDPASVDKTIKTIAGMAIETMKHDYRPITPLSQYKSFETVTGSTDPESAQGEMNRQILTRLSAIEDSVRVRDPRVSRAAVNRGNDANRGKRISAPQKFVELADRVAMMTIDRDDYDISDFNSINDSLSKLWFGMSVSARDEAKLRLKDFGIPFPDIIDLIGLPVIRSN